MASLPRPLPEETMELDDPKRPLYVVAVLGDCSIVRLSVHFSYYGAAGETGAWEKFEAVRREASNHNMLDDSLEGYASLEVALYACASPYATRDAFQDEPPLHAWTRP